MTRLGLWEKLRLPAPDEDRVWELFHENSKTGCHDSFLSQEEILERMNAFQECLGYDQYPAFDLPKAPLPVPLALDEAIRRRASCQAMRPCVLTLDRLAFSMNPPVVSVVLDFEGGGRFLCEMTDCRPEQVQIGGTCVLRGCVPKKFFVYASEYSQAFRDAKGFGWTVDWARFDWPGDAKAAE